MTHSTACSGIACLATEAASVASVWRATRERSATFTRQAECPGMTAGSPQPARARTAARAWTRETCWERHRVRY